MTTTVYGITNCDTVRRARRWLDGRGLVYRFHDFRRDGLDAATLEGWAQAVGWETLLNRRGTTWRRLDPAQRDNLDAGRAIRLMQEQPTLIRRPVIEMEDDIMVGFDEQAIARKYDE